MGDWIDDRLNDAENWVYNGNDIPSDHSHFSILGMGDFPPLSELIRDARTVYDVAAGHFPDPALMRSMATTLNTFHGQASGLHQEYLTSLQTLATSWTGPHRDAYMSAASQASLASPAGALLDSLQQNSGSFAANQTTHINLANRMDELRGYQEQLWLGLGGAVVSIGALIACPPDAEITIPTLTLSVSGAIRITYTVVSLTPLLTIIRIGLLITTAFALVEATAATVDIVQMSSASAAYPPWVLPDGTQLPKRLEKIAEELWDKYGSTGISAAIIAYLVAHYADNCSDWRNKIEYILTNLGMAIGVAGEIGNIHSFQDLLDLLSDPNQQNTYLGAEALLHAIMEVGPANVGAIDLPYVWRDANGNPEKDPQGNDQIGDIDILTKDSPPKLIECGTYNKGNSQGARQRFRNQIQHLVREAQQRGGQAYVYIQVPPLPLSNNQRNGLRDIIDIASQEIDGTPYKPYIDPNTGAIDPPPPAGSHVIFMEDTTCQP